MKRLTHKFQTKTARRLAFAAVFVVVVAVAAFPESANAGIFGLGETIKDALLGSVLAGLVNMVLTLVSWLLWLAGGVFNYTVNTTLNMNALLANIPVVDIGWRIIRDIANIVFIFIALWSGISITLGLQAEKAWGLLAHMVLVALFINFSLFITKTIVDGTNIAALHFYNLMKDPASTTNADADISGAFMNGLKLQTLWNSEALEKGGQVDMSRTILSKEGQEAQTSEWNIILVGVFGSIFLVITAFVFFAAAILFLIRAITLIMLMILSPLAFVAWILPGASGLASKWWSTLWSQAFFAPLYMALAYVVVATINSPTYQAGLNNLTFAAAFTSVKSPNFSLIFNFLILIGLMIGCLIVAQSLGGKGAELGMKWAKGVSKFGAGVVGKGVGMGARTALRFGETTAGRRLLGQKWGDRMSMRYWNERFSKSTAGNTAIGKFIRQQTTGRLVEGKIFGKSAEEAHKEAREDTSKIRIMNQIRQMRSNSHVLDGLNDEEAMIHIKGEEDRQRAHEIRREVARRRRPPAGGGAPPTPPSGSNPPQGNPPSGQPPSGTP